MSTDDTSTIVVVDDTPANLRLLAGALSSEGYRIRAFPSGELALKAMAEEAPDLILLDINMPGMSGYEVCVRLKADETLWEVPVLFISAMQDTDTKVKAFEQGGVDYITKPFRLEEVFARVSTHLQLRQLRQRLEAQNALLARKVEDERQLTEGLERESRGRIEAQQFFIEHMARVDGLTQLTDLCSQSNTEQGLLTACAGVAQRITAADFVELLLSDAASHRLRRLVLHSKELKEEPSWAVRESLPWAEWALREGKLVSNDTETDTGPWASGLKERGFRSGMATAVLAGATPVGVLMAASRFSQHFDAASQSLIQEFAGTLGSNLGLSRVLRALETNLETADSVLTSVLPAAVSDRLKEGESQIADRVPLAGVFFCDLEGFTAYSSRTAPEEVVGMLQETFGLIERACARHRIEKIKTIGDAFMAVSGVSMPVEDPIERIADFALAAADALRDHLEANDLGLGFRIGVHAGPVISGVLGTERLFFDIWGDTVNFASRLESSAAEGEVRCSETMRQALADRFDFEDRGMIPLKGKGEQRVWALLGRGGSAAASGEVGE